MIDATVRWLARLSDSVDWLTRAICIATALAFVCILLTQVFVRYVLQGSLPWYADAVKLAFKWSLFMGMAIAYRNHSHIVFPFMVDRLPEKLRQVIVLTGRFATLAFFVFLVWGGSLFFDQIAVKMMPVLGISESWAALALPVSTAAMAIHAARYTFDDMLALTGLRPPVDYSAGKKTL